MGSFKFGLRFVVRVGVYALCLSRMNFLGYWPILIGVMVHGELYHAGVCSTLESQCSRLCQTTQSKCYSVTIGIQQNAIEM